MRFHWFHCFVTQLARLLTMKSSSRKARAGPLPHPPCPTSSPPAVAGHCYRPFIVWGKGFKLSLFSTPGLLSPRHGDGPVGESAGQAPGPRPCSRDRGRPLPPAPGSARTPPHCGLPGQAWALGHIPAHRPESGLQLSFLHGLRAQAAAHRVAESGTTEHRQKRTHTAWPF